MIHKKASGRQFAQVLWLLLLCMFMITLWPNHAKALAGPTGAFPNASNNPNGVNMRTEVVKSGNGISLQAGESDYNVFIPSSQYGPGGAHTVTITIKDACDSAGLNDFNTGGYDGSLKVGLFSPVSNTQVRGWESNGENGAPNNCTGNNIVFNGVFDDPNFEQDLTDYGPFWYYLEIRVVKTQTGTAGVKNYSVDVSGSGSTVTFASSTGDINSSVAQPSSDAFAIWNAAAGFGTDPPNPVKIAFYFSPDCNYTTGDTVWLKWGGADQGTPAQPDPISFDLVDVNSGATVLHIDQGSTTWFKSGGGYVQRVGMGGALDYNAVKIPGGLKAGDEYKWQWNDVDHLNGINLWMPFTDVDTQAKCQLPCSGNATPGLQVWQPGETTTLKLTFNSAPVAQSLNYQIPGLGINNTVSIPANVGSYTVPSGVINIRPPNGAGQYDVTWQPTNATTACKGTLSIVDIPYVDIYNGGLSAGGDFNACSATGGTLASWYDNSIKAGASTLLADLATGTINGFASSQNTGAGPPGGAGNTLSFANSAGVGGTSPSNSFGGNYGGAQCLFSPNPPTNNTPLGSGTGSIGSGPLTAGAFTYTGNYSLGGGTANGQVGTGNNLALYVTGNVYIGSDVIYGTNAGGTWTINPDGTTNIPSFVVVAVGGNIYVDPGVKELDGIYVAESKSGTGGTIYTCGESNFTPTLAANLYNCNNQLLVHGSFVADQVNLMRTLGTLDDTQSNPGETPYSAARPCTNGVNSAVCAGEIFNFSPEVYVSQPMIQPPNNGATSFDDIATLPPVL